MRPVGETEFVNGVAAMSASGGYGKTQICAGIVGHADMTLGAKVEPVLEAHMQAGGGRFRGIRHITAWDAAPGVVQSGLHAAAGPDGRQDISRRLATLGRLGLSFDAWLYHPQIDDLAALAKAVPDTQHRARSCRRSAGHRSL